MFRRRTRPMPQPQAPMYRRIYARLTADRGPGKKKLWVLLAIPLAVLFCLFLATAAAGYLPLSRPGRPPASFSPARARPSTGGPRHYRPSIVSTVWSGDEQLAGEFYNER